MRNGFTAVVEQDGGWFITYSPEIPGANGQGKTKAEALPSLSAAIALIPGDRREDGLRGVPAGVIRETVRPCGTGDRPRQRGNVDGARTGDVLGGDFG